MTEYKHEAIKILLFKYNTSFTSVLSGNMFLPLGQTDFPSHLAFKNGHRTV